MTESHGDNRDIQLPGYTLVSRIGAGGYGEVWLAEAPGGLTKAVKFIFGFHNEKRAARELHSLEKIKEVRHPFLLSLERIEIIDGRLVIITELADRSLKDRFDECVEEGYDGIPRDELLRYLRDTADALDYLSNQHSLQHLDVKPENLLLLAGHIKVADFGLVKEIQNTQASLVGGMTPLYSSPEVFQGMPSSFSDQYSLAVLYQEMLTGQLPFSGVTAAELTLQHMHDEPDLSALPMADRYVLARALSKNSEQRFASCSEMVDALLHADNPAGPPAGESKTASPAPIPTKRAASKKPPKRHPGAVTQVFDDALTGNPVELSNSMLLELPPETPLGGSPLPPLDLTASGLQPTPTLVIGIGGTAGQVLQQLRQRITHRFGTNSSVPAVQLLLLDTDPKTIVESTHGDEGARLQNEETLTLALRRPQEYRDRAKGLQQWLSRRWLYNIPKSLRTEGLRPLGRLAFIDHARRTIQRIRMSLSQAIDTASTTASNEATGLNFRSEAVRVYLVASISGGTGSGISLDVAYATKTILEKLGIANASTVGILLHSTGHDSRHRDLAQVNAYSWLTEFNHFNRPGGCHPGDDTIGLPPQPVGTQAFDDAYLVHLGNGLTSDQFSEQTAAVAEYIYLDALSPAQTFFSASRDAVGQSTSNSASLRTFGLYKASAISSDVLEKVTELLCHQVVLGWSGADVMRRIGSRFDALASEVETASVSDTDEVISGTAQAVAQLQMNMEGMAGNARLLIEGQFGGHVEDLISKLLADASEDAEPPTPQEIVKVIDGLFAGPQGAESAQPAFVLGRPLEAIVSPLGLRLVADLQRWLLSRLDDRQQRLTGVESAAKWFGKHFERVEADATRITSGMAQQLDELVQSLNVDTESGTGGRFALGETMEVAVRYFRLQLDIRALQAARHITRTIQAELKSMHATVIEFGRHLRHLANTLDPQRDAPTQSLVEELAASESDSGRQVTKLLLRRLGDLATAVDGQLQEEFIDPQGGLFSTVMSSGRVMSQLLEALRSIARQHVERTAHELSVGSQGTFSATTLAEYGALAAPALLELGGVASPLMILPHDELNPEQAAQLRSALGDNLSLLPAGEGDTILCCEAGQIPLSRVAVHLIQCRRDYTEFASRVHTRSDVEWTPLVSAPPRPIATPEEEEFATQVL